MRLLLLTLTLCSPLALFAEKNLTERAKSASPARVLFIGNSYSFDVPKLLGTIAQREKKSIEISQVTNGGWTLQQHSTNPKSIEAIASKPWDAVVLQEQSIMPSLPSAQRDASMLPAAKKLIALIDAQKSHTLLYQTWGRRDGDKQNAALFPNDTYAAMQKRLNEGFATLHKAHPHIIPVPVNHAWEKHHANGHGTALYVADGSHPSAEGNYLAAAVFYCTIYRSPITSTDPKIPNSEAINRIAYVTASKPK